MNNSEETSVTTSGSSSVALKQDWKVWLKIKLTEWVRVPIVQAVVIPVLLVMMYQGFIQQERFESQAIIMVKSSEAIPAAGATFALLSGMGGGASNDANFVESFVHSADMLAYLDQEVGFREHFSSPEFHYFSRVNGLYDREDYLEYFRAKVLVEVDPASSITTVSAQAFTAEFAQLMLNAIVSRTEWYINEVGHQMARQQVDFISDEADKAAERLAGVKNELLGLQSKYGLLDPLAEGSAQQEITFNIEGLISRKEAELRSLQSYMSNNAPAVVALEAELLGLRSQAVEQRLQATQSQEDTVAVSLQVAEYSDLQMRLEFATQSYSSALVALEMARMDAYKQLKFLSVIQSPTLPESNAYPRLIYNSILLLVILLALFIIASILVSVFKELSSTK